MSQTTLRLLKYDPAEAVLIMANNHLNLHLRPEYATVSPPTAVSDTLTEVTISGVKSSNDFIPGWYNGSFQYRYDRLRVNEILGSLHLDLTPPITIYGVLKNISDMSGFVFTENDFVNDRVETSSFVLRAKPESLRWIGEVIITLNEPSSPIWLADAMSLNVL